MIYLASPYSHPDKKVMRERYQQAQRYTAKMMNEGHIIFSPINYGHHLAENYVLPTDAKYWQEFNETILRACTDLWVLRLPGWATSKGVILEIAYADSFNMPTYYKDL